jgi:hypothetical protein
MIPHFPYLKRGFLHPGRNDAPLGFESRFSRLGISNGVHGSCERWDREEKNKERYPKAHRFILRRLIENCQQSGIEQI